MIDEWFIIYQCSVRNAYTKGEFVDSCCQERRGVRLGLRVRGEESEVIDRE